MPSSKRNFPTNPDELKSWLIGEYPLHENVIRSKIDWNHINSPDTFEAFIREDLGDPLFAQTYINRPTPRVETLTGNFVDTDPNTGEGGTEPPVDTSPTLADLPHTPTVRFHPEFSNPTVVDGRVTFATDLQGLADASATTGPDATEGPLQMLSQGGVSFWRFDDNQALDVAGTLVANSRDISVVAVMRDPGVNFTNNIFCLSSRSQGTTVDTQGSALAHRIVNGEPRSLAMAQRRSGTTADASMLAPGAQLHVAAASGLAGNTVLQMNSTQNQENGNPFNIVGAVGAEIGRKSLNLDGGDFDLYEIMVFQPALTPTQLNDVVQALMTHYNIIDFTSQFVMEGDSISAGTTVTNGTSNPSMLLSDPEKNLIPPTYRVTSGAQSGDTIDDLLGDLTTNSEDFSYPLAGDTVVAFEIGRNSLGAAETPTEMYAKVVTYINSTDGLLQQGVSVRVLSNIASSSNFAAPYAEYKALINNPQFLIDCDAAPGGTYEGKVIVINIDEIEIDGLMPFASPLDPNYYNGDSTHPNVAGAELRVSGGDTPELGMAFGLT